MAPSFPKALREVFDLPAMILDSERSSRISAKFGFVGTPDVEDYSFLSIFVSIRNRAASTSAVDNSAVPPA